MKTAMQQLKDKIQIVISEMNGELSSYESGYKQCLINIQNDIDDQMVRIEREQIIDAWMDGVEGVLHKIAAEKYYNETYGGDK